MSLLVQALLIFLTLGQVEVAENANVCQILFKVKYCDVQIIHRSVNDFNLDFIHQFASLFKTIGNILREEHANGISSIQTEIKFEISKGRISSDRLSTPH